MKDRQKERKNEKERKEREREDKRRVRGTSLLVFKKRRERRHSQRWGVCINCNRCRYLDIRG